MNATEARAWGIVAGLLRGDLDHGDEMTRADIASACALLDRHARDYGQLPISAAHDWDAHLCRVMTDPA